MTDAERIARLEDLILSLTERSDRMAGQIAALKAFCAAVARASESPARLRASFGNLGERSVAMSLPTQAPEASLQELEALLAFLASALSGSQE